MPEELYLERPLFGGSITCTFPSRFQDVSNIRQVPDHQEVFADPGRDESLIFELLDFKHDVGDNGSAAWFLLDLASEQNAEGTTPCWLSFLGWQFTRYSFEGSFTRSWW